MGANSEGMNHRVGTRCIKKWAKAPRGRLTPCSLICSFLGRSAEAMASLGSAGCSPRGAAGLCRVAFRARQSSDVSPCRCGLCIPLTYGLLCAWRGVFQEGGLTRGFGPSACL